MKRFLATLLICCMLLTQFAVIALAEGAEVGTSFPLDDLFSERNTSADYGNDLYYQNKKLAGLPNTIETWVYFDSTDSTANGVLLGNSTEGERCINFGVQGRNPRLLYKDRYGNEYDARFTGVTIPDDAWTHVAVVNDESTHELRCYLNGALAETKAYYPAFDEECIENWFTIGGDQRRGNSNPFRGSVKGLALYGDARTSAEIAADYTAGDVTLSANTADTNLLCAYDFSAEYSQTNIKDISNNGVDLTYSDMWATEAQIDEIFADSEMERAFSIAVVGDTQMLLDYAPHNFSKIYNWIVSEKDNENIEYVIGVGDITDDNDSTNEWPVAAESIKLLNNNVPYSLVRGNHDVWKDAATPYVDQYFATDDYYMAQFDGVKGGLYKAGSVVNSWTTFTPEGSNVDFLILNLDYCPADAIVEWAKGVVEAHPDHKIILNTHAYNDSNGMHYDLDDISMGSLKSTPHDLNPGDQLWEKLVSKYENFVMTFCGHVYSEHAKVTQRQGDKGNTVTEFLMNPQSTDACFASAANAIDDVTQGVGNVALLHFNADATNVQVEYYSTVQEMYYRSNSAVELDLVNGDIRQTPDYTQWHGVEIQPEGAGTMEEPYLIENAGNLLWMARHLDKARNPAYRDTGSYVGQDFDGCYFKQTQDIDLMGYAIPSIGFSYAGDTLDTGSAALESSRNAFSGIYDGQGYKIHNGTIVPYARTADLLGTRKPSFGLFGAIWGAEIKDVHLDNVTVVGEGITGGIVGKASGPSSGLGASSFNKITKCSVSNTCQIVCVTESIAPTAYDDVTRAGMVGGIVGAARATTVSYCTNAATLKVPGLYGMAGGIAGTAGYNSVLDHCANTGSVILLDDKSPVTISLGGILGATSPKANTVDVPDAYPGYIKLTNCYNSGALLYAGSETKLTSGSHWGGIVGYAGVLANIAATLDNPYPNLMNNCHNSYPIAIEDKLTGGTGDWSGGLVGKAQQSSAKDSGYLYAKDSSSVAISQTTLSDTVTNEWRQQWTNSSTGLYTIQEVNNSVNTLTAVEQAPLIAAIAEEIENYVPSTEEEKPQTGPVKIEDAREEYASDGKVQIYPISTLLDLVYAGQYATCFGPEDTLYLTNDLTVTETFDNNGSPMNFADSFNGFAGANTFVATFDGQGHTIYNYKDSHALFLTNFNGTVKNLTLKNAVVTSTESNSSILMRNTTDTANIDNVHLADCVLNTAGTQYNGLLVAYNHSTSTSTNITNCSISDCSINATGATLTRSALVIGFFSATKDVSTHTRALTLDNVVVENSHITATAMADSGSYTGLLVGSTNHTGIKALTFRNVAVMGCSLTATGATAATTGAILGVQKAQSSTLTLNNIYAFGNTVNDVPVQNLAYFYGQYHPKAYSIGSYTVDSGITYVTYDNHTPADSIAVDAGNVNDAQTLTTMTTGLNSNGVSLIWGVDTSDPDDHDVISVGYAITFKNVDGTTALTCYLSPSGLLSYVADGVNVRPMAEADWAILNGTSWLAGYSDSVDDIVPPNGGWETMVFTEATTYTKIPYASQATAGDSFYIYQIDSAEEFVAASRALVSGTDKELDNIPAGETVILTADIDCSNYTSVVASGNTFAQDFQGFIAWDYVKPWYTYVKFDFNGLGHTISNYHDSHGLFPGQYGGTISNLTIEDSTVTETTTHFSPAFSNTTTTWTGSANPMLVRSGIGSITFDNVHMNRVHHSTALATDYVGLYLGFQHNDANATVSFTNCSVNACSVAATKSSTIGRIALFAGLMGTGSNIIDNCIATDSTVNLGTNAHHATNGGALMFSYIHHGSTITNRLSVKNSGAFGCTMICGNADTVVPAVVARIGTVANSATVEIDNLSGVGNVIKTPTTAGAPISNLVYDLTGTVAAKAASGLTHFKSDDTLEYALLDSTGANSVAMGSQAVSGLTAAQAITALNANGSTDADWYKNSSGVYVPAFAYNQTQNKIHPYAPWDPAANDLAEILENTANGDTLLMGTSVETADLVINSGVTLDLAGHTLTTESLFADGWVTDSTDGNALLVDSTIQLAQNNPQFPLYDSDADGYRLFNYEVASAGSQQKTADTVTFGYRLNFTSQQAYTLLQSNADQTGMDFSVNLTCGETEITYVFTPELIATYADYMLSGRTPAFTLTVKGLDALTAGTALDTVPTAESHLLVAASGSKNSYIR